MTPEKASRLGAALAICAAVMLLGFMLYLYYGGSL